MYGTGTIRTIYSGTGNYSGLPAAELNVGDVIWFNKNSMANYNVYFDSYYPDSSGTKKVMLHNTDDDSYTEIGYHRRRDIRQRVHLFRQGIRGLSDRARQ